MGEAHAAESEVVTGDGARLRAWVQGEGRPVILIPGLATGAHAFAQLAPMLAGDFRVITFDPRGIGASEFGNSEYTVPRLAADVVSILDSFDAKPAVVFGLSMGGLVAMELALAFPDYVQRLILGATYCSTHLPVPPRPGSRDLLLGRGTKTPADAYRSACRVLYSAQFVAENSAFIDSEIDHRGSHPISGRTFTAQEKARSSYEACARLGELKLPTLVIHGSEDALIPEPNARDLMERICVADYRVLEGAGHLFFHEDPPRTCALVRDFLAARFP
jgi:pimeloyl-ACP methyl ester carboxylesterase